MTKLEQLYRQLEDLNGDRAEWIEMDDFNDYMSGYTPTEIAQKVFYGDFRYCDDYFKFNGYDNIDTCEQWQIDELDEKIEDLQLEIDELELEDE